MNKKIRQVLSAALVFTLLFFLVACGKSAETTKGSSAQGSKGSVSSEEDGPFTPYAEPLIVSVPLSENANTFYVEGESIEDNFVTRFYTEKLNIKYVGKWSVDSSQADEKLNAAVASNDLPDIFTAGPELMGRLIKAG